MCLGHVTLVTFLGGFWGCMLGCFGIVVGMFFEVKHAMFKNLQKPITTYGEKRAWGRINHQSCVEPCNHTVGLSKETSEHMFPHVLTWMEDSRPQKLNLVVICCV